MLTYRLVVTVSYTRKEILIPKSAISEIGSSCITTAYTHSGVAQSAKARKISANSKNNLCPPPPPPHPNYTTLPCAFHKKP